MVFCLPCSNVGSTVTFHNTEKNPIIFLRECILLSTYCSKIMHVLFWLFITWFKNPFVISKLLISDKERPTQCFLIYVADSHRCLQEAPVRMFLLLKCVGAGYLCPCHLALMTVGLRIYELVALVARGTTEASSLCEDTVRRWLAASREQESSSETSPASALILDIPASRAVRKCISPVETTWPMVFCCGSLSQDKTIFLVTPTG